MAIPETRTKFDIYVFFTEFMRIVCVSTYCIIFPDRLEHIVYSICLNEFGNKW